MSDSQPQPRLQTLPPGLNLGCGPFPAPPHQWHNVDVSREHAPNADQYIRPFPAKLPFPASSFERVYLGHVLEHVHFEDVPKLLRDVRRVLAPNGQVCVVGPDVIRAEAVDGNGDPYPAEDVAGCYGAPENDDGTGWPHLWNCTEALVIELLTPLFRDVTPHPITDVPSDWPLTSKIGWQCAVTASK